MSKKYVFGGSFDPFHIGHEAIVAETVKEFGQILLVPTQNPWKPHNLLSLKDRIEMLREFYKDQPGVEVSDLCLQDPEYNYMYKIVEHYPEDKIIFIMGEDAYASFHLWKNYVDFSQKVETIVFKRDKDSLPNAPRIRRLPSRLYQFEISSTLCRQGLDKNKHMLPPRIYELVKEKIKQEKA